MTSAISALTGVTGPSGLGALSGLSGITDLAGSAGLDPTGGLAGDGGPAPVRGPDQNFAGMLAKGLDSVQAAQTKADGLAVQVADGSLQDPAQYTMAANEAALGLQLTLAVRNKALDAFQEIMRMQA